MQKKKTTSAASKKPQIVPGMEDILPETTPLWDLIFRRFQKHAVHFGFLRAETPLIEYPAIYGAYSDKAPACFSSEDGTNLALRADLLPGVLRAYSDYKKPEEHKFSKWYYIAPVITQDQKQKFYASDWQFGLELLGNFPVINEVQLITAVWKFYKSFGFEGLNLEVNNIATLAERVDYERVLSDFLQSKKYELCNNCVNFAEEHPLQIFNCKNLSCRTLAQEAPQAIDYLPESTHRHFTQSLETLDEIGIIYNLNPCLVGEIGASGTVFSFKIKLGESEHTLGQGSGHSDLTKTVSAREFPAFGYQSSFSGLQKVLQQYERALIEEFRAEVFLAPLGDLAIKKASRLFSELWDANIFVHDNFGEGGVKNQLKLAEAARAIIALIIGQKEAMDDMVILRDVKSGMQEVFQYDRIIEEVKKRLGK